VWWYPPGSDRRVNRVSDLRHKGLRTFRDLRWQLWFEGAADIWDRLKADLVAAYPRDVSTGVADLATQDEDLIDDAIVEEAPYLATRWGSRPLPTGEPFVRVSASEQETLAHVAIGAAIPGHALPLDAPFDDVEGGTTRDRVEDAWGRGSAAAYDNLVSSGGSDATKWEEALRTASPYEAMSAAELMRRALNPRLLRSDLRLFNDDWGDRSMHVAGLLHSLRSTRDIEAS
jgi:hypothetical protein